MAPLIQFALFCLAISLTAVGGASTLLPALHAEVVTAQRWLDDAAFVQIVTLSQLTPGPNILFIPLVGWVVGGFGGAALAVVAILTPSSSVAILASRTLRHHEALPAVKALRRSMRPVASGALCGAGLLLAWSFARGRLVDAIVLIVVVVVASRTNISSLWYIGAAAVVGAFMP
jgi:chromate transporter